MFIEKDLIIKDCHMGRPTMTGIKEEDLAFFAPRVLEDFYQHNHPVLCETLGIGSEPTPVVRIMAVLPYVADHYGLDKNELLQNWTSEFGLMHMMRNKS